MNRTIAVVALIFLAGPAMALERSPDQHGQPGQNGRGHQAQSERGDRTSQGGREHRGGHEGSVGETSANERNPQRGRD